MVFPVLMYRRECCTIKKAECWRIDIFELCCWRRLFRVPWTARWSNQSVLKEMNPEYSLEGLKLQYFDHLVWTADSLRKTLMLGKMEGRRRKGQQRIRWLGGITDLMNMGLSKLWETVKGREARPSEVHGIIKRQMWLSDWTTTRTKWERQNKIHFLWWASELPEAQSQLKSLFSFFLDCQGQISIFFLFLFLLFKWAKSICFL